MAGTDREPRPERAAVIGLVVAAVLLAGAVGVGAYALSRLAQQLPSFSLPPEVAVRLTGTVETSSTPSDPDELDLYPLGTEPIADQREVSRAERPDVAVLAKQAVSWALKDEKFGVLPPHIDDGERPGATYTEVLGVGRRPDGYDVYFVQVHEIEAQAEKGVWQPWITDVSRYRATMRSEGGELVPAWLDLVLEPETWPEWARQRADRVAPGSERPRGRLLPEKSADAKGRNVTAEVLAVDPDLSERLESWVADEPTARRWFPGRRPDPEYERWSVKVAAVAQRADGDAEAYVLIEKQRKRLGWGWSGSPQAARIRLDADHGNEPVEFASQYQQVGVEFDDTDYRTWPSWARQAVAAAWPSD